MNHPSSNNSASWKASPSDPVYEKMRSRLLSSASDIIRETGVNGLRLESVAKHAGVARSSLYRYFDSKDQLVYELLVYEVNRLSARFGEATASIEDPVERMLEIIVLSIDAYRNDPSLRKLVGSDNGNSLALIAIVLEKIPGLIAPILEGFGFFDDLPGGEREKKYQYFARWLMNIVFALGVFGSGGLSPSDEKTMVREMLVPVLSPTGSSR